MKINIGLVSGVISVILALIIVGYVIGGFIPTLTTGLTNVSTNELNLSAQGGSDHTRIPLNGLFSPSFLLIFVMISLLVVILYMVFNYVSRKK